LYSEKVEHRKELVFGVIIFEHVASRAERHKPCKGQKESVKHICNWFVKYKGVTGKRTTTGIKRNGRKYAGYQVEE
jgi:hypothetical protein